MFYFRKKSRKNIYIFKNLVTIKMRINPDNVAINDVSGGFFSWASGKSSPAPR